MLRIAHLVRQYHPSVGGLETFVADLANAQIAAGAACDIVTLDRIFEGDGGRLPAEDEHRGVRLRRVPMIGVRRYFAPLMEASMLDAYDVLHVHGIDGFFEKVARRHHSRAQIWVATTHGAIFHTRWLAPLKRIYFNAVSRPIANRYDLILANSQSDEDLFEGLRSAVELVPNGVHPMGPFLAQGGDILTVGRLASHKRVNLLIEALAASALRDRACKLHVVGPAWDIKVEQIQAVADRLGVTERVVLHGRVSDAQKAALARECGVFVSASEYEGFGMTLIEAMSVGLAVVVQENNSFRELLGAANCGKLVDFARPGDAAESIAFALDHTQTTDRLDAQRFAAQFSWKEHARRTLELYGRAALAKGRAA